MSTLLTDEELLQALREIIKSKRISLRSISNDLGVPYRTVQNYFGGESKIPASFFLNLCVYIGLEPDFIVTGDFRPREEDLYDAVWVALHQVKLVKDSDRPPMRTRWDQEVESVDQSEKVALIRKITVIVAEQYDRYRREWLTKKDSWTHGRRLRRKAEPGGEVDQQVDQPARRRPQGDQ